MTPEERRAAITYNFRRMSRSPAMGAPPIESLWPDGIARPTPFGEPDPSWSDEEMDRIEYVLDHWGL